MLVCQTLDFIFGILGLVNKIPNLSSWDFILVTLGIPKPQTLDFISGNGLEYLVIQYGSYMDSGYNLLKEIIFKKYKKKQHICTILIFQYVSKAALKKKKYIYIYINMTFLILNHFPVVFSPLWVSRCCFPVVSSRCTSPFWGRSPRARFPRFPTTAQGFYL